MVLKRVRGSKKYITSIAVKLSRGRLKFLLQNSMFNVTFASSVLDGRWKINRRVIRENNEIYYLYIGGKYDENETPGITTQMYRFFILFYSPFVFRITTRKINFPYRLLFRLFIIVRARLTIIRNQL